MNRLSIPRAARRSGRIELGEDRAHRVGAGLAPPGGAQVLLGAASSAPTEEINFPWNRFGFMGVGELINIPSPRFWGEGEREREKEKLI